MDALPRAITLGVNVRTRREFTANAARRGLSGFVCKIAVFSNSGVIAQSRPASKISAMAGVRMNDLNGASQPAPGSRFSQYAPETTSPTPNKPCAVGTSPRKTAEINTVNTGLNINNGVTKETSACCNARVEARCAMAFNPADPNTPNTKSQSIPGNRGANANANKPNKGNARRLIPQTTTSASASFSICL